MNFSRITQVAALAALAIAVPVSAQDAKSPEGQMIAIADSGAMNECGVTAVIHAPENGNQQIFLATAAHCVSSVAESRGRYLQVRVDGVRDAIHPRGVIISRTDVAFLELSARDQRLFVDSALRLPRGGEEIGELIRSVNAERLATIAVPNRVQQNDTLSDYRGTSQVTCDQIGQAFPQAETIVVRCSSDLVNGQSGSGLNSDDVLWAVVSRDTSSASDQLGGNVAVAWLSAEKLEGALEGSSIRLNRGRDLAMVGL